MITITVPYWLVIFYIFVTIIQILESDLGTHFLKGLDINRTNLAYGLFLGFIISIMIPFIQGFIEGLLN
jgi:hypothetical protein